MAYGLLPNGPFGGVCADGLTLLTLLTTGAGVLAGAAGIRTAELSSGMPGGTGGGTKAGAGAEKPSGKPGGISGGGGGVVR